MRRTPQRSPPQLMTLETLGARGMPLWVMRMSGTKPEAVLAPKVSTFFMVFVLTEGRGRGRHLEQVELRQGDIHLVPAGVEHQPLEVGNLRGWVVCFDPGLLRSIGPEWLSEPLRGMDKEPRVLARSFLVRGLLRLRPGQTRWRRIVHLVAGLDAELREARWGVGSATQAWFMLLMTELLRELQEHVPLAPPLIGGLVRDALAFIETNCLRPLSLQDVAAAVGCTSSHLANVIREETGLTVGEWLREHRMTEARRLLLETDSSMERIASQVGYTDVTHFIRTFRRVHAVTPRVWRERRRRSGR
ncbi:MAG: AraC family transcriptional regulator [Cystobacter sp.]